MSGTMGAKARLMSEYKSLSNEKWLNIDLKNGGLYTWIIGLMVINPESYFDGGYFKAEMTFSNEYPYAPPTFRFMRPMWHPNIYTDGKVCISILHPPGEEAMSGESATERWSPLQGVESILRSILLLLDDPEISSPANVDASIMFRRDRAAYIERATATVKKSKTDIPEGFVMPTTLMVAPPPKREVEDDGFWAESEDENDFGGSDSSGEDMETAEFGDDDEEDADQEFEDSEEDTKDLTEDMDEDED